VAGPLTIVARQDFASCRTHVRERQLANNSYDRLSRRRRVALSPRISQPGTSMAPQLARRQATTQTSTCEDIFKEKLLCMASITEISE
jgi:hypothetical protein